MVGAARQVHCDAVGERRPGGGDGAAHRAPRPLHQGRRPGEADAAQLTVAQRARLDPLDVAGLVHPEELHIGRRRRHPQLLRADESRGRHRLAQSPVLAHREAVIRRQRQGEGVAVERSHLAGLRTPRDPTGRRRAAGRAGHPAPRCE